MGVRAGGRVVRGGLRALKGDGHGMKGRAAMLRAGFRKLHTMISMNFPPSLARFMLLCCAALWGGSYLVAKSVMVAIPPQWMMFLRMTGACLFMILLFPRHILPHLSRRIILPGLVVGITYYGTMAMQTVGLKTVDPGRSAFLTASYCVFTPFVVWLLFHHRPSLINLMACVICLAGVGFVALKPGSSTLSLSRGDWLTLGCALAYAFNLTMLSRYSRRFSPLSITFVQFAVAGVLFLGGALVSEPGPNTSWLRPWVVAGFLDLFLGATFLAQVMQNIGLAHIAPESASVVMCTESLFSVAFSVIFLGERLSWTSFAGFALIFAAVLMSVIKTGPRRPPRPVIVQTGSAAN